MASSKALTTVKSSTIPHHNTARRSRAVVHCHHAGNRVQCWLGQNTARQGIIREHITHISKCDKIWQDRCPLLLSCMYVRRGNQATRGQKFCPPQSIHTHAPIRACTHQAHLVTHSWPCNTPRRAGTGWKCPTRFNTHTSQ